MHVVATAGHVDHGKSTLVRALTGMEPDRWAEERRRGMTIDLGYAWMPLGSELLAFVDVPGHERFIANMLAGLGPAPAVLFVVAADQGWQAQSEEHLAAVSALGVRHVLLVVTRSDLAEPGPALRVAVSRLRAAGLSEVPAVAVSAVSGAGLDALRAQLGGLVASLPAATTDARVRLWIDRAFSVRGAGTVVTGTLDAGTVGVGDTLELGGGSTAYVRSVQSAGEPVQRLGPVARVALNLRGVALADVRRGDVLLAAGAWDVTEVVDVRVAGGDPVRAAELMLHVGTAAVPVRVRPLGGAVARLRLRRALPLIAGDRAVLRNPGSRAIAGVEVLDADPPALRRRGAAAVRAAELAAPDRIDAETELRRRGAVERARLIRLGFDPDAARAEHRVAGWLITGDRWQAWVAAARDAVAAQASSDPLAPGLTPAALAAKTALPSPTLTPHVAEAAGLIARDGLLTRPDSLPSLGAAETAIRTLEQRLGDEPFAAPDKRELAELGLGARELAVAERSGRLVHLPGGVVLRADAATTALGVLAGLPQPFTLSDARVALGTTRRVAVPLMEHLDELGLTTRVDGTLRRVR